MPKPMVALELQIGAGAQRVTQQTRNDRLAKLRMDWRRGQRGRHKATDARHARLRQYRGRPADSMLSATVTMRKRRR